MNKSMIWIILLLIVYPVIAGAQNAAVVIKDTSCIVLDFDESPYEPPFDSFEVFNTVKVVTNSANCNRNVSCHGELPVGSVPPDKAVGFNFENTGLECLVNFGVDPDNPLWVATQNWHQIISPKGNVSLTCHFKDCNPAPSCPDPDNPFCPPGTQCPPGYYPLPGGGCCPFPPVDGTCPQ